MSLPRVLPLLGLCAALAACAINPVPVSALPGPNKDYAAFQKDETACRVAAARTAYPNSPAPQAGNVNAIWQTFFTSYGKCEAARGNLVQPVPWAIAYQLYLGYGLPYPIVYGYPPPYAMP